MKSGIAQTQSWRYKSIEVIKRQKQTTFSTNTKTYRLKAGNFSG